MVSHISVSKVTETSEPASMSELIMTTILREELDYGGLIITDAFDMASITEEYTPGEAAVGAFEAGADLILMPQNLPEAYEAVLEKVQSGEITEKRLNDTVQRILQLKYEKGIMTEVVTKITNNP
jgi:beta-N-acetylhexosaminidase